MYESEVHCEKSASCGDWVYLAVQYSLFVLFILSLIMTKATHIQAALIHPLG